MDIHKVLCFLMLPNLSVAQESAERRRYNCLHLIREMRS